MASKKSISIYSSLLLLTLTLGAFVPVTSFADDGIATNDAVLTQPTTDRATTGPSTAPSDGDLARSNELIHQQNQLINQPISRKTQLQQLIKGQAKHLKTLKLQR